MRRARVPSVALALVVLSSCGDDSDAMSGTDASSDGSGTSAGTSGASTSTSAPTSTSDSSATSASTTASTTTTGTTDGSTGSTGTSGATDGSSTGGTGGASCPAELPDAPITPVLFTSGLVDAEDIAFDGSGLVYGRNGTNLVSMNASGVTNTFVPLAAPSYDLQFDLDGDLIVVRPVAEVITSIDGGGTPTDIATMLDLPVSVHVDSSNRIWVTNPGQAEILRIEANGTVTRNVISGAGASSAGGIVFDENRGLLFFTSQSFAQLRSAPIDAAGEAGGADIITQIPGTSSVQGLALDACGNLYAVDRQNSLLYRVILDEAGEIVGSPELLASFESFVFTARFGKGTGFSETSLYVTGPSNVWQVDVGVGSGV